MCGSARMAATRLSKLTPPVGRLMRALSLMFIMLWVLLAGRTALGQEHPAIGLISFYLGQIDLRPAQSEAWTKARLKASLAAADSVRTERKSRCEITFLDQYILRIGERVTVVIDSLPEGGRRVELAAGEAWVLTLLKGGRGNFHLRTPTAVCAIRGTVYRVTTDSTHAHFRVYEGSISVTPIDEAGTSLEDTTITVAAGSELIIIRDFDQYRRQQQASLNQFIQEDSTRFAEYQRRQAEMFRVFQQIDQQRFRSFRTLNIASGEFDQARDAQLDWVRWNLERDKLLRE